MAFAAIVVRVFYLYETLLEVTSCMPGNTQATPVITIIHASDGTNTTTTSATEQRKYYTDCENGEKWLLDENGNKTGISMACNGAMQATVQVLACVYKGLTRASLIRVATHTFIIYVILMTVLFSQSAFFNRFIIMISVIFQLNGKFIAPPLMIIIALAWAFFSDAVCLIIFKLLPTYTREVFDKIDKTWSAADQAPRKRLASGKFAK